MHSLNRASSVDTPRASPRWLGAFLLASMFACAPEPLAPPPAKDPHGDQRLKTATEGHEALATQLAAVPKDDLQYCRTNSGDCLISVTEQREALVQSDYLTACQDRDPEKQSPCVIENLQKMGKLEDLTSYYEAENWCSRKLLECAADLQKDVARAATRERARKRRREIEDAPKSVEAASLPDLADDQVKFVRSTLPPAAQSICAPTTPEQCAPTLKAPVAELEAELEKDDTAYSKERALADYTAIERAKADCYRGESTCLNGLFSQYSGSAESAKLLDQNAGLLEAQTHAKLHADPDAVEQCLSDGVIQNRDRIVSAYQEYVGNPAPVPLAKLLKAFVALHQAQLWCIQHLKNSRAK